MSAKYCSHCGTELTHEMQFCPRCGFFSQMSEDKEYVLPIFGRFAHKEA